MKRALYLLAIGVGTSILLTGCDFVLEEEGLDFIAANDFYETPSDADAAVMGVYQAVAGPSIYGGQFQDMVVAVTGQSGLRLSFEEKKLSWDASWDKIQLQWGAHYEGINRANIVLAKVPQIEMDEQLKRQYLAEARLLRALLYFNLVRMFGDVPLKLEPTESLEGVVKPRTPASSIYEIIIEDLTYAEQNLPLMNVDAGRVTKGLATALLAKVYLTMAGCRANPDGAPGELLNGKAQYYQKAYDTLIKLVDPANPAQGRAPYNYALEPDFSDLWWITSSQFGEVVKAPNENGPEAVWEINYGFRSDAPSARFPGLAIFRIVVSPWFVNLYDDNDYRLTTTVVTEKDDPWMDHPWGLLMVYRKFPMTSDTPGHYDNNWPYLRFADVLLMFAEVENELHGPTPAAFAALNAIRERARNADAVSRSVPANYTPEDLPNQEAFREAVYKERILELSFEGHAWFGWLRTCRLQEVITEQGRNYEPRLELFPIPQDEIELSKGELIQNPGY